MAHSAQQLLDIVNALTATQSKSENRVANVHRPVVVPKPDPTLITTYKDALKYFVKYLGSNDAIVVVIGSMVKEQDEKEAEWYASREKLIRTLENKKTSQKELSNILSMVTNDSGETDSSAGGDISEVDRFDLRVYDSLQQMTKKYQKRLQELQIPLFCVSEDITRVYSSDQRAKLAADRNKFLQFLCDWTIRRLVRRFLESSQSIEVTYFENLIAKLLSFLKRIGVERIKHLKKIDRLYSCQYHNQCVFQQEFYCDNENKYREMVELVRISVI